MYCLFSDTPRFSDSLMTDQMCHQIEIVLYSSSDPTSNSEKLQIRNTNFHNFFDQFFNVIVIV